ncbi:methionyl-tRNA formyltransferase [Methylocapsa sp. S129]|uniref:methionyl-tRNA formyltransferase n=1 Tax=Methylocapsa sp. S129 TaxID=1641869 RepID=UPI00131C5E26|nr:methionyl-tRNA formyltransferase [Methylocapsa sp. S129]
MRIVFMGTPDFATPTLLEIIRQGHNVVAVYTRAPKPAGRRGLAPTKTPVHEVAERFSIPVLTPATLKDPQAQDGFRARGADVAVVVAYGLILPGAVLAAPAFGCLNLHASLLPRWRGAAPIQRAIMAGDVETGVSVMRMEEGLDTGPVALEERIAIDRGATAGEIAQALAHSGAALMARALPALAEGSLAFHNQSADGATYARKIDKSETRIDWRWSAAAIRDHIRGLSPSPGAYSEIDLGRGAERVKFLRAAAVEGAGPAGTVIDEAPTVACGGGGAIRILEAQRAGRAAMSGQEFQRGAQISPGAKFI